MFNEAQSRLDRARLDAKKRSVPFRCLVPKSRQTGISTYAEALGFWMAHLWENRTFVVMAHDEKASKKIFRMTKRYYDNLPDSVKPETAYSTKGEIQFEHNDSRIEIEVPSAGGGRGTTAQGVHLSEFALYPDPDEVIAAVMQAVPDNPDTFILVESTGKGFNTFYELCVQAENGQNDWTLLFVPWFEEPGYSMPAGDLGDLDEEETRLVSNFQVTSEQLAWRRYAIRTKCKGSIDIFHQEYPSTLMECFLQTGRPVFSRAAIEWHQHQAPPHVEVDDLPPLQDIDWDEDRQTPVLVAPYPKAPLRILKPPMPRHRYACGSDPSEGDPGSDESPSVVTDLMTGHPVAVWCGRLRPDKHARKARSLCVYYNNAVDIWEANNHGMAFGIETERLGYANVWQRTTPRDSVATKVTGKVGFMTSIKSKSMLFDRLIRVVDDMDVRLSDPRLIAQLINVYYDDNDQVQNFDGKPKDLLVAYALTIEVWADESPDLEPLRVEEYDALAGWRHRNRVAASMGIPTDDSLAAAAKATGREDMTARDIEELDERAYRLKQRRNALSSEAS
ncbi:MAG: hypothetical protein ACKVW3_01925 [Phycisphaerales bacterium]